MHVTEWPVLYVHLNLHEYVLSIFSKSVYADVRQNKSMAELETTIIDLFQRLVSVMPYIYIFHVIYKDGGYDGY